MIARAGLDAADRDRLERSQRVSDESREAIATITAELAHLVTTLNTENPV